MKKVITTEERINALRSLQNSQGWKVLEEFLQDNVNKLGEEILSDINGTLTAQEKTTLSLKRYYQKKLIELPLELIKQLETVTTTEEVNFDPFE